MPTYTYRFEDGTQVDTFQPITDEPWDIASHPETGEMQPVKRVYHSPGVVLKGRGFYRTGG